MTTSRDGEGLFPAGTLKSCLVLAVLFVLSRLAYYAAGVRFLDNLSRLIQVADLTLLGTDLFRTILLLHFQPPLFNLLVGIVLKISPGNPAAVFHILYLLIGLALTVALFLLGLRLGLNKRFAFFLALLFAVTPATILLENWAFYTYPVTLLLVVSALALNLFVTTGKIGWLFVCLFCAAALVLTRSMFHPLWLLLIPVTLFALLCGQRRQITTAALVPLLVVALWMAKNYYTVGSFTTVTQLGMHFSNITIMQLSGQERTGMYASGDLSALGLYPPFKELEFYRQKTQLVPAYLPTGVPIMDNESASTGFPNFNNPAYVEISRRYLADDLSVIRRHPGAYAHGVLGALCLYFQPPHDQVFSPDNVERLGPLLRVFDIVLYGQFSSLFYDNYHREFTSRLNFRQSAVDIGMLVLAAFVIVLIFWLRRLKGGSLAFARGPQGMTIWFMYCNLAYVTVIPNLFAMGENARLRYPVEPFLWLLVTMALIELFGSRKSRPDK